MAELISRDDVQAIARLARLRLTDAEIESIRVDLTAILQHMDVLRELDTDGVEPMTHVLPDHRAARKDAIVPSLAVDVALAQAPERAAGHFAVPSIIATDGSEPDA